MLSLTFEAEGPLGGRRLLFHFTRKAEQTITRCLTIFPKPTKNITAFNTLRDLGVLLMSVVQVGRHTEAEEAGLLQLPRNQGVRPPNRGHSAHLAQMCVSG